jgi:hypothetical protein
MTQQPAAAGQLFAVLAMLGKGSHRRGKLAVVKAMTASADPITHDLETECPDLGLRGVSLA